MNSQYGGASRSTLFQGACVCQGIVNSIGKAYWAQFIKIEILGLFNYGFMAHDPLKGTVICTCPEFLCWRFNSQSYISLGEEIFRGD